MSKLIPRKPVPDLKVRTVDGEDWNVTLYGSIDIVFLEAPTNLWSQ